MNLEPGKTYVRRLSAVSRERDALALRLRLERALTGADFHPTGLPASAILCVRRLSDRGGPSPHARGALAFAEWQRSVAAAIEQLSRHAASPARGPVPANAEAVIFSDRAELLACLAADWCEEAAPARWWWRSLFKGLDAAALLSAWLSAPEHVPAALGGLGARGKLIPFAHRLGEDAARSIRCRVVEKFGLYEIAAALYSTNVYVESATARAGRGDDAHGDLSGDARGGIEPPQPNAAPWHRYAPELRGYDVGLEQSCMVGVGLMLLRAPARVRSTPFAESLRRWRFGADASAPEKTAQPRPRPEVNLLARSESEPEAPMALYNLGRETPARSEDIFSSRASEEGNSLSLPFPKYEATPRVGDEHEGVADEESAVGRGLVNEYVSSIESDDRVGFMSVEVESAARPSLQQLRGEEREPESESLSWKTTVNDSVEFVERVAPPVIQARIQTRFGGLFYLINLALSLNLYGDFTTPLRPGIALPLWDFLALLGERLCGVQVREDAVWGLLAGLAGRPENEPPGHDFAPGDAWRMPAEWLAPFPKSCDLFWSEAGGRLRVRHAEGFLILDVTLARAGRGRRAVSETRRQLDAELHVYGGLANLSVHPEPSVIDDEEREGDTLERWLNRLLPYVNTRLRYALGVRESVAAARLVCEHVARVSVSETRLDVTFALERLPVEVRLSGLDRDPGWVPAAGRSVAFHFE